MRTVQDMEKIITALEDETEFKKINNVLEMQKIPDNIKYSLKRISEESETNGWQWVVLKAYFLGVIIGKRNERKKHRNNQY